MASSSDSVHIGIIGNKFFITSLKIKGLSIPTSVCKNGCRIWYDRVLAIQTILYQLPFLWRRKLTWKRLPTCSITFQLHRLSPIAAASRIIRANTDSHGCIRWNTIPLLICNRLQKMVTISRLWWWCPQLIWIPWYSTYRVGSNWTCLVVLLPFIPREQRLCKCRCTFVQVADDWCRRCWNEETNV